MKDRILFIGGADTTKIPNNMNEENYEEYFDIAGGNVGNFVYTMYLKSYLDYDHEKSKHIFFVQELDNIKDINNSFDKVVICCANQINPRDTYLIQFYDFLKKTSLPIILLGLGCQSDVKYSTDFINQIPEHIKFLNMLKSKKAIIGVRGNFTQHCLDMIDIPCYVIGCPSFYKNGFNLNVKENKKANPLIDVSCEWICNGNIWYKIITSRPCNIICQSKGELCLYKLGKSIASELDIDKLRTLFGKKAQLENINNPFIGRCKIFFNIKEWENFIKTRDFYIGPKIHGCLMHLLNGIPAMLIAHDSRTREFAEFMHIPHILARNITEKMDLMEYYLNYNATEMEKAYTSLFYKYLEFLQKAGLKYNFTN